MSFGCKTKDDSKSKCHALKMNISIPASPIKLSNGYHSTQALPHVEQAKAKARSFPTNMPNSVGYVKAIGNMNTYKISVPQASNSSTTFYVGSAIDQAVAAAAQLASSKKKGTQQAYAILASGTELYASPLFYKNVNTGDTKLVPNIDYSAAEGNANNGRGMSAKASIPELIAIVGRTRWIDLQGALKTNQ